MATDDTILVTDSVTAREGGIAVGLKIPWYRSLWVSSVSDVAVKVDGVDIAKDSLRAEINGGSYTIEELGELWDQLWFVRDRIAQRRDVSPGRVLSDAALVGLAVDPPKDAAAFAIRRELRGISRGPRVWLEAIDKALALPEEALPPLTLPSSGPPPPRRSGSSPRGCRRPSRCPP